MSAWPFLLFQKPMPAVWPVLDRRPSPRPLAEVVVQGVEARRQAATVELVAARRSRRRCRRC